MSLQTIMGLSGISLLLSTILFRLLNLMEVKKQSCYLFTVLLFVISFIPFTGDSINLYFRGLLNDLSITSIILLCSYLYKPDRDREQTSVIFFIIVITGLFFYPAALGFSAIDPYSWGFLNKDHGLFPPIIFLCSLSGLMLYALIKNNTLLLLSLVLSTLAYQFRVLESQNIWDYLFDPVIFIYALIIMPGLLYSLLKKSR